MLRPYQYKVDSICPVHAYWDGRTYNLKAVSDPVPGPQSGYEHGEDYPWLIQVDVEEFAIDAPVWVGWDEQKNHWEFFEGFISAIHIFDHE